MLDCNNPIDLTLDYEDIMYIRTELGYTVGMHTNEKRIRRIKEILDYIDEIMTVK